MGCQYEMQKNWDGGGSDAYKIFTSWLVEGNIPNTISYMGLFMATMKMRNNLCNGYQYETQKSHELGGAVKMLYANKMS